jgi:hypothetical protein
MAGSKDCSYLGAMYTEPGLNVDLLEWFSEDERRECLACGVRASVSFPDVTAQFCLHCGAITIDGVRIDKNGVFPL